MCNRVSLVVRGGHILAGVDQAAVTEESGKSGSLDSLPLHLVRADRGFG